MSMVLVLLVTSAVGANAKTNPIYQKVAAEKEVILATTTSTQDSGLLDYMLPTFEKRFNVKVKVIAVGTGQAIQLGKDKNADVVLVHSRKAEDEFVRDGFGHKAHDVMYNQFLIVGPKNDPANIKSAKSAADAFKKIAGSNSKFISRGDDSGTHKKELSILSKAGIKPEGKWYVSAGQGMGETLRMGEEMGAYVLTDEATYLTNKTGLINLSPTDKDLFNPYGIIQVTGTKKPHTANELIWFFISPEGQSMINQFGRNQYGKNLFVPDAKRR
ncbi:tungsten ABC transporter substrate-binding protein [Ammoniphilus sp. CFH 90114]|nr:tungsten ABC transporter substrate-binding protein [Ammoniphilus sp. CFH 90114]